MTKTKTFIKNRKGQRIAVLVEIPENPKGLAFVMHGLSGNKEQPHIQTFAQAFIDAGCTTVLFDTTNTFGESEGDYADATVTNYYEDLEDVIEWSKNKEWHQEPFYLAGHSLGSLCITYYAENHPGKVKALAPISVVVSGKLSVDTKREFLEEWKLTGWRVEDSNLSPDGKKRLKWSHMEDRMKYDLLPNAHNLTMPVLLVVGDRDEGTPPAHQKILFDALPGPKEIHIIKGAGHTFREGHHLKEIRQIFDKWIKRQLESIK
jgi:uncharacterized protein